MYILIYSPCGKWLPHSLPLNLLENGVKNKDKIFYGQENGIGLLNTLPHCHP